jgi:hypothetical protein
MKMDLKKDLMEEIEKIFEEYGIRYNKKRNKSLNDHLVDYLTLNRKLIAPVAREVKVSKLLELKLSTHPKRKEVEKLQLMLARGENVNMFQSKRLLELGFHDHMLYEWYIHHLHLPELNHAQGGKKKTNALLFVYIDDKRALLLDVDEHRDHVFAETKWLEIIYDNWYEVMEDWLGGDYDSVDHYTAAERQSLWDHGVTMGFIKVREEMFYSPGIGRVTTGHSLQVVTQADQVHIWLDAVEEEILKQQKQIEAQFKRLPLYSGGEVCIRAKITHLGIVVYEEETGRDFYTLQ